MAQKQKLSTHLKICLFSATETSQTTSQLYTYFNINMIMIMFQSQPVLLPFNSVV